MGMGVKHSFKSGKEHKGGLHKLPNGQLHSGTTHGPHRQRLFHFCTLITQAKGIDNTRWGT